MGTAAARGIHRVMAGMVVGLFLALPVLSQQTYLTFTQADLALKKAGPKVTGTLATFVFKNTGSTTVGGLRCKLNSNILGLATAGVTNLGLESKGKGIVLSFDSLEQGDSITVSFLIKKQANPKVVQWSWNYDGSPAQGELLSTAASSQMSSANGGDLRDYLYKYVVSRPAGLVIGVPGKQAWIRYLKSDPKYFPHTGAVRCLDSIANGKGGFKEFLGELKNPKLVKHDNMFVGELHALKLAILANDYGVTDSGAAKLGDLVYNDTVNATDTCNGKSLRQIIAMADTALGVCEFYPDTIYKQLYNAIKRVDTTFAGSYITTSLKPLHVSGGKTLADAYFLHPGAASGAGFINTPQNAAGIPAAFALMQNYPNPFNPSTMIRFTLSEPSVVSMKVFNLLGQQVATLLDGEQFDSGEESVEFNASSLPSGVYYYMVRATGENGHQWQEMKRMMLVK